MEWIATNSLELLMALITAGALGLCGWFGKQVKNYKAMLKTDEQKKTKELIDAEIQPILAEIEELRKYINAFEVRETTHINLIISSWRYRLIQLCRIYQRQGYMTADQYDQLTELYRLYHELGGNGQAKEEYERTIALEVKY